MAAMCLLLVGVQGPGLIVQTQLSWLSAGLPGVVNLIKLV